MPRHRVSRVLSRLPAQAGLFMPAEWKRHAATWLAFPHHRTDFPGKRGAVAHTFCEMARTIAPGERVRLLVRDAREHERARSLFARADVELEQVDFIECDTNRSWTRDSMPLWVKGRGDRSGTCAVKFRFNGWARYRDHGLDDAAGVKVAKEHSVRHCLPRTPSGERIVLEGGAVDVDGAGTALTTESCLVTSAQARFDGPEAAEDALRDYLGVKKVIWLGEGIVGDDTSGHVDDFARFAPQGRVLLCHEPRRSDANHAPLAAARRRLRGAKSAGGKGLEIVPLPMPEPVVYGGERLPASYANFYVANRAVLVPVFNDRHDQEALSIIGDCFRDRPAIGIYARDLVVGLGTIHCSTMQEPA